jgi:glycosyltransferase involved in cell wall biosynthesis
MPSVLTISHSYVVALNRRLVREMARLGGTAWRFRVVAPSFFHAKLRPIAAEPSSASDPFAFETLPVRLGRSIHLFLYGSRLRNLLRGDVDLVHAWEEPYVLAGAQIAAWMPRGVPLVLASYQNIAKRYPPPFAQLERYAVHRSSAVVAGGHTVAEALAGRRAYRGKRMPVIPLGVDLDEFLPDAARGDAVRRSLGWDTSHPPVVGFLGRFVEEKGVLLLCRALERTRIPWRALFIGEGPLEAELRRWALAYGDRVRVITGVHHPEVPDHLNAMDVLCAPSLTRRNWREQVGRMLIEAFASGVPVMGSSSGEIPHTIGDAGLIVREGDVVAWTNALEGVLTDPAERARLSAGGLARARGCFGWPVVARAYLDLFDELLAEHGSSTGRDTSAAG